jgi:hypothetical protein
VLAVSALGLAALSGGDGLLSPTRPVSAALETELLRADVPRDVAAVYEARDYRPLWVSATGLWPFGRVGLRPEAAQLPARTATLAGRARLTRALAAARSGRPGDLARAEVALSLALGDYAAAQRRTVRPPRSPSPIRRSSRRATRPGCCRRRPRRPRWAAPSPRWTRSIPCTVRCATSWPPTGRSGRGCRRSRSRPGDPGLR